MTGFVHTLTSAELNKVKIQAQAISDSASSVEIGNKFVFFAAFDGTNNSENPETSGTVQTTSVRELYNEVRAGGAANVFSAYFAGVGTPGTETGSSAIPTNQIIATAQAAYDKFAEAAQAWKEVNPSGQITSMITSFSRGGGSAAVFSQMIYEKGLVTKSGEMLIEPGVDGAISAALIMDPVLTGIKGNMAFPSTVKNLTVVRAEDEYRSLFRAAEYNDTNVKVLPAVGNHGDIGGFYDQGLGGIYLEGYQKFFSNAGLNMGAVPENRKFDQAKAVVIHSESVRGPGQVVIPPWSAIEDDASMPRNKEIVGTPVQNEGGGTRFIDYKGALVFGGTISSQMISDNTVYLLSETKAAITGTGLEVWAGPRSIATVTSSAQVTTESGVPVGSGYDLVISGNPTVVHAAKGARIIASGANITVDGEKAASIDATDFLYSEIDHPFFNSVYSHRDTNVEIDSEYDTQGVLIGATKHAVDISGMETDEHRDVNSYSYSQPGVNVYANRDGDYSIQTNFGYFSHTAAGTSRLLKYRPV